MPKIVAAILARNEADRYLREVLTNVSLLCDDIVLVDDNSTDGTVEMAREFDAKVLALDSIDGWWGKAEAPARAMLWNAAVAEAGLDGWVYVADADHILAEVTRQDLHQLARASHVNAWAWPLWDCWDSPVQHRVDGYWVGWAYPRPWMAKAYPAPDFQPSWSRQGLHVGHFPSNYPFAYGVAPGGIQHLGYVKAADRAAKAAKYLAPAGPPT